MKDEILRRGLNFDNPAPIKVIRHTKENTHAAEAHWQEHLRVNLLFNGMVRCFIDGNVKDLLPGDVCIVNGGEIFSTIPMGNSTEQGAPGMTLFIQYEFLKSIIPDYDDLMFELPNEEVEKRIAAILYEISDLADSQKSVLGSIKILEKTCRLIGVLLSDCARKRGSRDASLWKYSERQKEILNYIHSNYDKPIRQEEVAEMFNFSKTYFCRFFKRFTGKTFKEYLTDCRFAHAEQQLRDSEDTILEIALDSGFPDEQNFIKAFKKRYHETPGQYRKDYRQLNKIQLD